MDNYSRAIEVNPGFDDAYFNRALAYALLERYDSALRDLDVAHTLNPRVTHVYYVRGRILEWTRQFSEAIQCYSEALTIDPDDKRITVRLALLNELFKDENTAAKDVDEGRVERPEDTEPGKRLSELENTGRLAEALKSLQELLARNPDDHQLQLQKGILSAKLSMAPSIAVCGLQSIWDRLTEVLILPLLHHDNPIYHAAIVSTSRGILPYGPPGCGKTLTVSHLTHRAGITLLKITLAETLNLYVGESEKRDSDNPSTRR